MTDMRQYAPWPTELEDAVRELHYEPGWTFDLSDIARDYPDGDHSKPPIAGGLTFVIKVPCYDSYHPGRLRPVVHYHPVPAATFNRAAWERWLFDRLADTRQHEAAEWFRFESAPPTRDHAASRAVLVRRPFAPTHGPGDDPYVLHELVTDEQRSTSFRGELNP